MGGIFISYRRSDSGPWAGRVHDHLAEALGESNVFFDIDSIELGTDYRLAIESRMRSCDASLVIIGPTWLDARYEDGRRRIDDPADLHRIEVATALRLNLRVIPLLVGGAQPLNADDLPEELKPLAFRQARHVDLESFKSDIAVVQEYLQRIERPPGSGEPTAPAPTVPVPTVTPAAPLIAPAPTLAAGTAPPAAVPTTATRRIPPMLLVAVGVLALALIAVIIAVTSRDDGNTPRITTVPTTEVATPVEPSTTVSQTETSPRPGTAAGTPVVLPDAALVYNRPVDEATAVLSDAGLVVRQDGIGCSNSTQPGFVRQVTVGRTQNARILYGKSTDTIDDAAIAELRAGDEVTVWTPTSNPC